jgi:hypothetical protein
LSLLPTKAGFACVIWLRLLLLYFFVDPIFGNNSVGDVERKKKVQSLLNVKSSSSPPHALKALFQLSPGGFIDMQSWSEILRITSLLWTLMARSYLKMLDIKAILKRGWSESISLIFIHIAP